MRGLLGLWFVLSFSISILQVEGSFQITSFFTSCLGSWIINIFIPLEFSLVFINTNSLKTDVCSKDLFYPTFSYSPELTDLLLTALENPVKYVEDNVEQKVSLPL